MDARLDQILSHPGHVHAEQRDSKARMNKMMDHLTGRQEAVEKSLMPCKANSAS